MHHTLFSELPFGCVTDTKTDRDSGSLGASPYEEIVQLLAYPFDFFPEKAAKGSFLATVLSDLAAFIGDESLYSGVVNDIRAVGISPCYWQVSDTPGLSYVEADDILSYPNIEYKDNLTLFEEYDFAEHIAHETHSFRVSDVTGALGLMSMMLLLRDRYFPTLWLPLIRERIHDDPLM